VSKVEIWPLCHRSFWEDDEATFVVSVKICKAHESKRCWECVLGINDGEVFQYHAPRESRFWSSEHEPRASPRNCEAPVIEPSLPGFTLEEACTWNGIRIVSESHHDRIERTMAKIHVLTLSLWCDCRRGSRGWSPKLGTPKGYGSGELRSKANYKPST